MALEDFSSDDEPSSDSSNADNTGDNSNTDGAVDDEKDGLSGLESFNTNDDRGGSTQNNGSDNQSNEVFGIPASKWANMTEKERIAEVRNRKIPDFKPEAQLDERWSYVQMIAVNCVCGETITFKTSGVCNECGRGYARRNRTVVKQSDPEGVIIHNNVKDK